MDIDLLFLPDCPNLDLIRRRLQSALDATGVVAIVRETEISTPEGAERLGLRGSPTILMDHHDPFAPPGSGTSVSCRLFEVGMSMEGAPSVDQLVDALERQGQG